MQKNIYVLIEILKTQTIFNTAFLNEYLYYLLLQAVVIKLYIFHFVYETKINHEQKTNCSKTKLLLPTKQNKNDN